MGDNMPVGTWRYDEGDDCILVMDETQEEFIVIGADSMGSAAELGADTGQRICLEHNALSGVADEDVVAVVEAGKKPTPDTSREIAVLEKMVELMADAIADEPSWCLTIDEKPECGDFCAYDKVDCVAEYYRAEAELAITEQDIPEPKPLTCGECAYDSCQSHPSHIALTFDCVCHYEHNIQKRNEANEKRDRMNAERDKSKGETL